MAISPKNLYATLLLILCAVFSNGFSADFHPKIEALGFHISPTNTRSSYYGQGQVFLPVNLLVNQYLSANAEYFAAYSYFDKEKDTYDKLTRAAVNFNIDNFTVKAGRDYLSIGLDSVLYFGPYIDKDLKTPTYFDGAYGAYKLGNLFGVEVVGGKFDKKDFYGMTFEVMSLKGFYFVSKEDNFDLKNYGASYTISKESFDLSLLAAFNKGERSKKINPFITIKEEFKGKMFSGEIKLKKEKEEIYSAALFGVEYLSPDKTDSLAYRPLYANLDRGFIFGNLAQDLQTLTYKLGFEIKPKVLKDFSAEVKIYNFSATDKRKTNRDIASEVDLTLLYQPGSFGVKFIYGYLQAEKAFDDFAAGFQANPSINKIGLILSYQF